MEFIIGILLVLIVPLAIGVLGLAMIVNAFESAKDSIDKLKR